LKNGNKRLNVPARLFISPAEAFKCNGDIIKLNKGKKWMQYSIDNLDIMLKLELIIMLKIELIFMGAITPSLTITYGWF
jgi:hypothetical protein